MAEGDGVANKLNASEEVKKLSNGADSELVRSQPVNSSMLNPLLTSPPLVLGRLGVGPLSSPNERKSRFGMSRLFVDKGWWRSRLRSCGRLGSEVTDETLKCLLGCNGLALLVDVVALGSLLVSLFTEAMLPVEKRAATACICFRPGFALVVGDGMWASAFFRRLVLAFNASAGFAVLLTLIMEQANSLNCAEPRAALRSRRATTE